MITSNQTTHLLRNNAHAAMNYQQKVNAVFMLLHGVRACWQGVKVVPNFPFMTYYHHPVVNAVTFQLVGKFLISS